MGIAHQANATTGSYPHIEPVIITDPPYYDNISYADLSDFFYIWLRPLLRDMYPDMFSGMLTPKTEELIVAPRFRNGRNRFEEGLSKALNAMQTNSNFDIPSSIVYGYKQQKQRDGEQASTGWETMLNAVINAGYEIVGTWPMRTELANRQNSLDANSLASSVIIVIRPRSSDALTATRQLFLEELDTELPIALDRLTRGGHIAPADLPQSAIGPGMEIYSKYSRVETISGDPVTVREALQQINRVIGEYMDQQEGELDSVSRFCVDWQKTHAYQEASFGDAENIATRQKPLRIRHRQHPQPHQRRTRHRPTAPNLRIPPRSQIPHDRHHRMGRLYEDGIPPRHQQRKRRRHPRVRQNRQTHGRKPRLRRTSSSHPLQPLRQPKPTPRRLHLQPTSLRVAKHPRR